MMGKGVFLSERAARGGVGRPRDDVRLLAASREMGNRSEYRSLAVACRKNKGSLIPQRVDESALRKGLTLGERVIVRRPAKGLRGVKANPTPAAEITLLSVADVRQLLTVPDIVQPDSVSCGAACAAAVGQYFRVGPTTVEEWERLLGTDEDGTPPANIVAVLRSLGLQVTERHGMTVADLQACWQQGRPVICPVQEWNAAPDIVDDDGHYVVVIGAALNHVFVQDPVVDAYRADGGSDEEPGRMMIDEATWLRVWHDQGADGTPYVRYGIAVGPAPPPSAKSPRRMFTKGGSDHPRGQNAGAAKLLRSPNGC